MECLAYSSQTRLLASGGLDNQLYLWRIDEALSFPVEALSDHYTENAGSCLVTASSDRVIRYWDLRVATKPIKLVAHHDNIKVWSS